MVTAATYSIGHIKKPQPFPPPKLLAVTMETTLSCILSPQQTVKKFLALAQHFRLPLFLADPAVLTLLSQDALLQRDRLVREPHCSFLCSGRPVTAFALQANLWKYNVSLRCGRGTCPALVPSQTWFPSCAAWFPVGGGAERL